MNLIFLYLYFVIYPYKTVNNYKKTCFSQNTFLTSNGSKLSKSEEMMIKDKKHLMSLKYMISTDKFNLLRDGENKILYFFKKLYYKLQFYLINGGNNAKI